MKLFGGSVFSQNCRKLFPHAAGGKSIKIIGALSSENKKVYSNYRDDFLPTATSPQGQPTLTFSKETGKVLDGREAPGKFSLL